jgi:hypothetical protein
MAYHSSVLVSRQGAHRQSIQPLLQVLFASYTPFPAPAKLEGTQVAPIQPPAVPVTSPHHVHPTISEPVACFLKGHPG